MPRDRSPDCRLRSVAKRSVSKDGNTKDDSAAIMRCIGTVPVATLRDTPLRSVPQGEGGLGIGRNIRELAHLHAIRLFNQAIRAIEGACYGFRQTAGRGTTVAGVSLHGVRKSYGDVAVVHGVDLDIADGEFVVFVGPSGCGKCTLLRMIAGLEDITAGEIVIDGTIVNELPPTDRDIAMVFQNYALYPHMTVFRTWRFSLRFRGVAKAEIDAAVDEAARILEHRATAASARPRAALRRPAPARRASAAPSCASPGLPVRRAAVEPRRRAARADAGRDRSSFTRASARRSIYVTHDQVEAMTLADRIVVHARAAASSRSARPRSSTTRPANVFVAGFIGAPPMNLLPAEALPDHGARPACWWALRPEHLIWHGGRRIPTSAPFLAEGQRWSSRSAPIRWCRSMSPAPPSLLAWRHGWCARPASRSRCRPIRANIHFFDRATGARL